VRWTAIDADETIAQEPQEPAHDRYRDPMGEAGVSCPALDAVGELVATEQLDIGDVRTARHDLEVGIEARHEASTDGGPCDPHDRGVVALAWHPQPHRDDRRRRQITLIDTGRHPRRHFVAPR
jgi:hypothetical protein